MQDDASFTPAPTVKRYELDSETVLFNPDDGRIFVLNESAAFIWTALSDGHDVEYIADRISEQAGVDRAQVIADCGSLFEQWREAGLEAGHAPTAPATEEDSPPGMSILLGSDDALRRRPRAQRGLERRYYRIADLHLAIAAPGSAFAGFGAVLEHLRLPDDAAAVSAAAGPRRNRVTLTVEKETDGGWALYLEGVPHTSCRSETGLAPMVHATVLHLSYATSRSRISIHGAVVFSAGRCVLLPGKPGAGKSTLTAALVASNLGYCTDDFAMLDGDPLELRGIPLCIGLKKGSWPLLETSIPAVDGLPIHVREDGQEVRYLAPPRGQTAAADARFRTTAIVFPRISQDQPCRLEPLSRSTALMRISEAGYHLLGDLDVAAFEAMLSWLRSLGCYELSYSSLDEAVVAIRGLLDPDGGVPER